MGRRLVLLTLFCVAVGVSSGGANAATTPVTVTPAPMDFGSVLEGGSSGAQTFTVTNNGASPITLSPLSFGATNPNGEFSIANDNCSGATLAAGGAGSTCTFDALFTPQVGAGLRGTQTATVSVTDNGGDSPVPVSLTGTATAPQLTVPPVDFGDVPVGSSTTQTATVTNSGQGMLSVNSVNVSGTGFSIVTNGCAGAQLGPSQNCGVTLGFNSTAAGPATGSLTVGTNDPDQQTPAPVTLSANGTQPAVGITGQAAFNADLGTTSAPQTITINNTGTAPLAITQVAIGGTDAGAFAVSSFGTCLTTPVPAGSSCNVGVTFTASDPNPKSATIIVTDNAPDSPESSGLTGTANVPGVGITPGTVTFAALQVGRQSAGTTITIKDTGTAPLKIGTITLGGATPQNFHKAAPGTGDTCTGSTIAVGASCAVTVTFAPVISGGHTADLVVPNNDVPVTDVPLAGTGLVPPSPSSMNVAWGCDSAVVGWKLPTGLHQFLYTQVVRNSSHTPRSPTDGTVLPRATSAILNTGLAHYHSYYYAAYAVFAAYNGGTARYYSKPLQSSGHTQDICFPRNHSTTSDLTPKATWLPYNTGAKYSVLLQRSGRTILVKFPSGTSYQFPSSWTYAGSAHALQRGGVYFLYVYAYTSSRPKGFLIGQTEFTEAP